MRIVKRNGFFYLIHIALIGAIFAFGYISGSIFEMICSICAALFWSVQLWLYFGLDKDENAQRKHCKPAGFFMLLPAIGIIAGGICIFFRPYMSMSLEMEYCAIAFSTILSMRLLLQIAGLWKISSPAGRFLRLANAASMSATMSLLVVLILRVTQSDESAALSCMTAVIFGGIAFLIAVNMIMVSICGYKGTRDSIKTVSYLIKSKKLVFTRVSILKDVFLVAGKSIISIVSLSFFMFTNALFSAGMGIARFIAVKMHTQDRSGQIASYRHVGIIISAASICYVVYSARLFFGGKSGTYSMSIALVIALYTFVEFGINIKEAFRLRKSRALEAKALRAISFSATLLCFVLTQTAIMSFASEGDNSFSNALSGVVFGGLAALTGLRVILDSFSYKEPSEP